MAARAKHKHHKNKDESSTDFSDDAIDDEHKRIKIKTQSRTLITEHLNKTGKLKFLSRTSRSLPKVHLKIRFNI